MHFESVRCDKIVQSLNDVGDCYILIGSLVKWILIEALIKRMLLDISLDPVHHFMMIFCYDSLCWLGVGM